MTKERIQKALARQGLGSRRQIERLIEQGEIKLNDKIAQIGDQVQAGDVVLHGGRKIIIKEGTNHPPKVIMYHKPEGEVCTHSDPEGRKTIFDHLPNIRHGRWVAVGRLDLNTSGLILLTDNGELANRLMHPSHSIEREYAVRILGEVTDNTLKQITRGVELDDGPARFEEVVDSGGHGANHWYHVMLTEGRNREVRRIWEAVGCKVSRLMRVRYGPIILNKSQRPGQSRELTDKKVIELAALVGLHYEIDEQAVAPKKTIKSHKKSVTKQGSYQRGKTRGR